ncbi:hypothetical protein ACFWPX_01825 [Nocardia sp. NPDC058518]|uniref:hypothetical protein n=1 Tax=Nocardia sp. NPDC058518 TaxID=3346534 RepID=UPI003669C0D4
MGKNTPGSSRSDKDSSKSKGDAADVTVDVTVRGKLTISFRKIAKKLKWPVVVGACCVSVWYAPQVDIHIVPAAPPIMHVGTHP